MKKKNILLLSIAGLWTMAGFAQAAKDSARIARNLTIDEVVVTGTRNETDIRHLPMTISVVNRKVLERRFQPSVLLFNSKCIWFFFLRNFRSDVFAKHREYQF